MMIRFIETPEAYIAAINEIDSLMSAQPGNDYHKSARSIPDDVPDHWNIANLDDTRQQGRADGGAPADSQAARLPDDEDERGKKDEETVGQTTVERH